MSIGPNADRCPTANATFYYKLAFSIAMINACALGCRVEYHFHDIDRISSATTVDDTEISIGFNATPHSSTTSGRPWKMHIVASSKSIANRLVFDRIRIEGRNWRKDLATPENRVELTFVRNSQTTTYLNEHIDGMIDRDIAVGGTVEAEISGWVERGSRRLPFKDRLEFRSVIKEGTDTVNPLLQ